MRGGGGEPCHGADTCSHSPPTPRRRALARPPICSTDNRQQGPPLRVPPVLPPGAPVWGLREARTVHEAGSLARSPRPELSVAEPSLNLVLSQFKIQCPCELAGWTPASALPGNRLVGWGEERGPEGGIPARVPARSTTPGFGSRPRAAQQSGRGLWPPGPRALGSSLASRCPAPLDRLCGFTAAAGAGGSDNGA